MIKLQKGVNNFIFCPKKHADGSLGYVRFLSLWEALRGDPHTAKRVGRKVEDEPQIRGWFSNQRRDPY